MLTIENTQLCATNIGNAFGAKPCVMCNLKTCSHSLCYRAHRTIQHSFPYLSLLSRQQTESLPNLSQLLWWHHEFLRQKHNGRQHVAKQKQIKWRLNVFQREWSALFELVPFGVGASDERCRGGLLPMICETAFGQTEQHLVEFRQKWPVATRYIGEEVMSRTFGDKVQLRASVGIQVFRLPNEKIAFKSLGFGI